MKNKILSYLLGGFFAVLLGFGGLGGNSVQAAKCGETCDGVKLNTCFPIVGDCISFSNGEGDTNPRNAFPAMIGALTKVVMSLVLVVCLILVIVAGIMRAGDNPGSWKGGGAKGLLKRVAITILLLGFSGVILRLINPNFFG